VLYSAFDSVTDRLGTGVYQRDAANPEIETRSEK